MFNSLASAGRRALPNQWDLIAFAAILALLTAIAKSYHGISAPLPALNESPISLDYWQLPYYALRTTLRMFAALAASLVFTFTYATLAAKSRRAEMILDPAARHPAVGADPGFPLLHRDLLSQPLPRQHHGGGARGHLRDLHQPSLEHGLFLLPVAAHRSARPR